jgi:hypothetical protein
LTDIVSSRYGQPAGLPKGETMKRVLLAFAAVGGLYAAAGCGSSPCDKLQAICDKCTDSTTRQTCDSDVSSFKAIPGGDTDCQAAIDDGTFSSCK